MTRPQDAHADLYPQPGAPAPRQEQTDYKLPENYRGLTRADDVPEFEQKRLG